MKENLSREGGLWTGGQLAFSSWDIHLPKNVDVDRKMKSQLDLPEE